MKGLVLTKIFCNITLFILTATSRRLDLLVLRFLRSSPGSARVSGLSGACSSARSSWRALFHHGPPGTQIDSPVSVNALLRSPKRRVFPGYRTVSVMGQRADCRLLSALSLLAARPSSAARPVSSPALAALFYSHSHTSLCCFVPHLIISPSSIFPPSQYFPQCPPKCQSLSWLCPVLIKPTLHSPQAHSLLPSVSPAQHPPCL